jgi:hypothetical protein
MMGGGGGGGKGFSALDYGDAKPGVGYTAPTTASPYTPSYTPQTATPFLQSIMAQHSGQTPQNNSLGLPSLQSMFGMQQKNSPLQGGLQQLAPMMPYVGSTYRPNMSAIQQNLNNVAPSVELQARLAAEEQARFDAENPVQATVQDYGGGGG